jgi:hypothetical protein
MVKITAGDTAAAGVEIPGKMNGSVFVCSGVWIFSNFK